MEKGPNIMTPKQLAYIQCLEDAADYLEERKVYGCCSAIAEMFDLQVEPEYPDMFDDLVRLLQDTYRDKGHWIFYWPCSYQGKIQRIIALSLLIDMIETENLFL